MKKFFLLLFFSLSYFFSQSQDFCRVIKATRCDFEDDKWVTTQVIYPKDFFIIISGWDITIGQEKFKTYDSPEKNTYDDHVCFTWKCVDKYGNNIFFLMKKFNPNITTHMLYSILYPNSKIMYEYETDE